MINQCRAVFYSHCTAERINYIEASCIWCLNWRTTINQSCCNHYMADWANGKTASIKSTWTATQWGIGLGRTFLLLLTQMTNKEVSVSTLISCWPSAAHIYTRFISAREGNMAHISKQYSQPPNGNWFRFTLIDEVPSAVDGNFISVIVPM